MRSQSRLSPIGDLTSFTAMRSKKLSVSGSTLPAKNTSSRGFTAARTAFVYPARAVWLAASSPSAYMCKVKMATGSCDKALCCESMNFVISGNQAP